MKNILLILENAIEYDLARTVLVKLGFNVLSLQKGSDMHTRLQDHFPDVVVTSVLGKQDSLLEEFITLRAKRGAPQFIWVGAESRLKKLNETQLKLIDERLPTPIQPEMLIEKICVLTGLKANELIETYRTLIKGSLSAAKTTSSARFNDEKRAENYARIVSKIEKQDKVFTVKDLERLGGPGGVENSVDLHEKKKTFIRTLFKK